jgi:hypothetical protein
MCWFVAVTAILGGTMLALRPDGSLLRASPSLLRHTPFTSFLTPGLLLMIVVGLGNALAGAAVARETRLAPFLAYFAGGALLVYIIAEWIMVDAHSWLQFAYLLLAVLILGEAWSLYHLPWQYEPREPGRSGRRWASRRKPRAA